MWSMSKAQKLIDNNFVQPLTRIQMTTAVKQVVNQIYQTFSKYVDFSRPDHNVDLVLPDSIEI